MNADAARALIRQAIVRRVFPAAVVQVGASAGVVFDEAFGRVTFDDESAEATADTEFDLASLTKPIAATAIALQLMESAGLRLDDPVAAFFPEWRGRDRERVVVQDLLEHASGLPARLVDAAPGGRREFEHEICATALEYTPGSKSIYSDLGFVLLGFLLEDRGGAPLAPQFDAIRATVGSVETRLADIRAPLEFKPPASNRARIAPTIPMDDDARRGRTLRGEVHDSYAAALGGIAGHAGLFGTGASVGAFARAVLRAARGDAAIPSPLSPALVRLATTKSRVPESSRALGWDTMLASSSCGTRMSPSAFGHVGYTGTSVWIDPERDRYFVLLTNRACGGGTLDEMREVRRAFHDAMADT